MYTNRGWIVLGLGLTLGCEETVTAPETPPVPSLGVDAGGGGRVAWARDMSAAETWFDILIMNADGSGLRQLTNHPALDDEPAISPDGRYIVFHSTRTGDGDIYLMRSDGLPGTAQRVTWNPRPERHPTWSPDGQLIAYEAPSVTNSTTQIFSQRVPSGSPVQMTFGPRSSSDPAWSPDGDQIAFVQWTPGPSGTNRPTIFVLTLSTGTTVALTNPTYHAMDPAWSPDGRWIAYSTNQWRNDTLDIAVIPTHGFGSPVRATTSIRASERPVWSPSGGYLAIQARQPSVSGLPYYDVRRIQVSGANVLMPHQSMTEDDLHPDWR